MWYGPFPTLYKNRLPAYYLEGATTWNTQANGRFFLFGFLRKYDKLCAMTIHLCDPFRTLFCSISLVVTWEWPCDHVTGCDMRKMLIPGCPSVQPKKNRLPKPRPSLTCLSLVAQSCRMSILDALYLCHKKHPLKNISRDPTFGTGGISSRNPWRCLKAAFLVSTGTAKEKG